MSRSTLEVVYLQQHHTSVQSNYMNSYAEKQLNPQEAILLHEKERQSDGKMVNANEFSYKKKGFKLEIIAIRYWTDQKLQRQKSIELREGVFVASEFNFFMGNFWFL